MVQDCPKEQGGSNKHLRVHLSLSLPELKSPSLQREPEQSRPEEDQRDVAYKHHYILSGRGPATVVLRAINANVSICVQNTAQECCGVMTTFCIDTFIVTHCGVISEESRDLNLFYLLNLSDLCKAATKAKLSINTIYSKAFSGVILLLLSHCYSYVDNISTLGVFQKQFI